jgi:HAD superfamily hydrolase (TIGR01509 family)
MKWIEKFQLFLFDFDGLLVNTEHIHYQAYIDMMALHGHQLKWSFLRFCEVAHLNSTALKEALYADFPTLSPNWTALYADKKKAYYTLVSAGKVELMPGVSELLQALEQAGIRRCVATNSFLEQIELIRSQIPLLRTIPHWITRENYEKQKPDPDSYLQAIKLCAKPGDRIIGFEDSIRGIQALRGTPATPVLICPSTHPLLSLVPKGTVRYDSFINIERA